MTAEIESPPARAAVPSSGRPAARDLRDRFYLAAFLHLSLADGALDRREEVWIKRFLSNARREDLMPQLHAAVEGGGPDKDELARLVSWAATTLSMGEKRRFVYNLAQLLQSKGAMSPVEYERVLNFAERIGVADTEADAMLHSVYRLNDTFIAILGLLGCGVVIYLTRSVIIPFVIALFIAMIVHRIDTLIATALRLERLRWFTKLSAMVVILGVLFALVVLAAASGSDVAKRFPAYQARFQSMLAESPAAHEAIQWLDDHGVMDQLREIPIGTLASRFLGSLVGLLSDFVLVVIFTGFLVASSSTYTGVLAEMNETIGTYLGTKTLISLIAGLTTGGLCIAFGVDFALFWAFLAFLLNFIPVVGAIIAAIPPILIALTVLGSWGSVLAFVTLLIAINALFGQVIEPKLMGDRLALKPLAILLGLIFWGLLWGIPGMFLATPLMVLLRILAAYYPFSRGIERLLATHPG